LLGLAIATLNGRGFAGPNIFAPSAITRTFENPAAANFLELRQREVRRIPLPGTRVNEGKKKGRDYSESVPSFGGARYASMPANASRRLREPAA
jgi:hypothetical protein